MKKMPNPMDQLNPSAWEDLVARHNVWVNHNFPGPNMPNSSLGVLEEMGELAHCHLKLKQGIRGNEDLEADRQDSLADLLIYLLGVMDTVEYSSPVIVQPQGPPDLDNYLLRLGSSCGELAYLTAASLTVNRGTIAYEEVINQIVTYCSAYAGLLDIPLLPLVQETWAQVETRDWIAYPETGRAPVEAT